MKKIVILGSTGSIGVQTLDIVRENPDKFQVVALTANSSWELLSRQAREFNVQHVVVASSQYYDSLRESLKDTDTEVHSGREAVNEIASLDGIDMVVNSLVGYAGLYPTLNAIEKGTTVALANKETLVVAGELVTRLAKEKGVRILPIDSEHSAIFQCLWGEESPLRRLIVTCSGGSLRDLPIDKLKDVTPEQALRHPQWNMGAKITIDSSTLVNKGFEVIEAHWLFDVPAEKISVIQHPQSVIHSMVEFEDGAVKAQLGTPDMRVPISVALMYPSRAKRDVPQFSFIQNPSLTFQEVDRVKYPALDIAYDCLRRGGSSACTMNGANEVAVSEFLHKRSGYLDIVGAIEYALGRATFIQTPTKEEYALLDEESRRLAFEYLKSR